MNKLKATLLTLALCASAFVAQAQINVGFSAGTNKSNYSIKGNSGAISNDLGFEAGVSASIKLPFLGITPELWYVYNKFEVTDPVIFGGQTCDVKSQAVVMPVLFTYSVLIPLRLEIGPSFTLYDSARGTLADGTSVDLGKIRSSVGFVAGLKLNLRKITLSARYNGQIGRRSFGQNDHYKLKGHSYSIGVGYKLF